MFICISWNLHKADQLDCPELYWVPSSDNTSFTSLLILAEEGSLFPAQPSKTCFQWLYNPPVKEWENLNIKFEQGEGTDWSVQTYANKIFPPWGLILLFQFQSTNVGQRLCSPEKRDDVHDQGSSLFQSWIWGGGGWKSSISSAFETQKFQKEIGLLTSALWQKCNPDSPLDTWCDCCRLAASVWVFSVWAASSRGDLFLIIITNEFMAVLHGYQGVNSNADIMEWAITLKHK